MCYAFQIAELNGVCLLDIRSTFTTRLWIGFWEVEVRQIPRNELTDIEKALVEDFNQIILEEWCKQWEGTMSLTPSIIGTESTGKFLQTSPTDAMMLILTMEASFGGVSGRGIAVPYYTMEPVLVGCFLPRQTRKRKLLALSMIFMMIFLFPFPRNGMHSRRIKRPVQSERR